jgi:hypothetical protein
MPQATPIAEGPRTEEGAPASAPHERAQVSNALTAAVSQGVWATYPINIKVSTLAMLPYEGRPPLVLCGLDVPYERRKG